LLLKIQNSIILQNNNIDKHYTLYSALVVQWGE